VPLTAQGFDRAGTVSGLAYGSIFRTADLPINQVMIKVRGPAKLSSWILVLGGGTKGVYPSPWYGSMDTIGDAPVFSVEARTAVAAIGGPIDQSAGAIVFPGCLVAEPGGRLGVFIEGGLCIDLENGHRFQADIRTAVSYNQWVIDVFAAHGQSTLMRYEGPSTPQKRAGD